MAVARAFLRRDLRLMRSYRFQLLLQLVSVVLSLASYGFLSRLLPGRQASLQPYATDYFTFVLIGTGAATFLVLALGSFGEALEREQTSGTLEALLTTPNDARWLLLAGALWPVALAALNLAVYVAVGVLVFGARVEVAHLPLMAGMLALSLAAFSSMGLVAAATLIQVKRAAVVVGLTGAMFSLLGGVLYPVGVLPGWLGAIAHLLPVTYGLDGLRQTAAGSIDWGRLGEDCLALAGFTAVLGPLAMALVSWSLARARRDGTLSQY